MSRIGIWTCDRCGTVSDVGSDDYYGGPRGWERAGRCILCPECMAAMEAWVERRDHR